MATFYNQATLSYSGGIVNSNITTGELVEVLSASKTAVVDEYTLNSQVTYAINIVNAGNTAYNNLTVTDNLGGYTFGGTTLYPMTYVDGSVKYFVGGILQAAPSVTAGPPLTVSGINVPAGGNATILYTVQTNNFAPPTSDGSIENVVIITGYGITPITVTETILAVSEPVLSINKSIFPSTVIEEDQLTYTLVIQNTGNAPAVATDNVVITDTFNPALSGLSVTYNGTPWTSPANYTYDESSGLFQTAIGAITVPAATYTRNPVTGVWTVDPGVAVITVTGTI